MALKETIQQIADGTLPEEEQLALLKNLEASILAKQAQKEVEQQKDYVETAIETIVDRLKTHERIVTDRLTSVESFVRVPGPVGATGTQGRDGENGKDGRDGRDGINGKDGQDGLDGIDGVSVVDAYFAADNSLVLSLSNGEEIDAGIPFGLGTATGHQNISVLTQTGETAESLAAKYVAIAFETVSKNLRSADGVLTYSAGGLLTTINYADSIIKTLNYDVGENITSIVLSGSTPVNIKLTKTFSYDGLGNISAFNYS